jgi:hypothetical protein
VGEGGVSKVRHVVVEVREDLHRELRKQAILNDVKLYQLTNAVVEEVLRD